MFLAPALSLLVGAAASASSIDGGMADSGAPSNAEDNFDDRWVTASSDHFVIYATGGARVARRALGEAERAVQALRVALTINAQFPDDWRPLTLVLFAYESVYATVAPARTAGLFRPAMGFGETDLVLLRGAGRFRVLRHELVHRLTQPLLSKAPPWLSEGMAQYFQWTEATEDSVIVGSTAETAAAQRIVHDSPYFPPVSTLLAASRSEFYGPRAYGLYSATYWLVSTLNSDANRRNRLNRLIQAIAKGLPAELAWKETFSASDVEALERDYRSAPSRPEPVAHRIAWKPFPSTVSAPRPLDAGEVHVLLARLYGRSQPTSARRELDQAIERDPHRAEAFALRALFAPATSKERRDDAERAVALDATAPLGWNALGLALLSGADRADKIRLHQVVRRLASFEGSAESQCLAAILLDAVGDRARALQFARGAVRIAPTYFYGQAVLSRVAAHDHRKREAGEARARAWALAPDGLDSRFLDSLLGGDGSKAVSKSQSRNPAGVRTR